MWQTTIAGPVSCYGIGLHMGVKTQVTFRPAPSNFGIKFIRTDIKDINNVIDALYSNVTETNLSTTISNNSGVYVSTIEHLMAAVWGSGIDNLIIEIDNKEVPIMDGSSKSFSFLLDFTGKKYLSQAKNQIKILKEIEVSHNDSYIHARPLNNKFNKKHLYTKIDLSIDFDNKVIGKQHLAFEMNNMNFVSQISNARTFGFIKDIDYLRKQGLAKGASLENAIAIDEKDRILNKEGLRFNDEFVRHKMLDLIGDLKLASSCVKNQIYSINDIIADIKASKTSHYLNNLFLRKLFDNPTNFTLEAASY
ncbi:MAG TPA: UDP-3-O-acyl-N-acetylglucosamine deacetylase [Candidatus Megaira endosymbiont of Hartmannula sinica]|nr:UDP-3-O-acyl-N-acetylglucosamine deacetylase [Candidatus Megaera endosymbiont of Hartmannula sinica]